MLSVSAGSGGNYGDSIDTLAFYTSFVGRRALLADVREHLAASRVVTLVGHAGVGKTRVALRITEVARRTYRDGCWVVPLADLAEPELLSPTVAEALSLQGADRPWQVETLADHIADRSALLVLDNCEHLLSAVSDLVRGTARSLPERQVPAHQQAAAPAQRRGRHRGPTARASRTRRPWPRRRPSPTTRPSTCSWTAPRRPASDFELTPDNAPAVVSLCRELDGIPLAIELAAARIRALSPQEIRDSLTERLNVLNLGYRDADDRHQSLRACVEWSYHLCTELEQRFWARSSVFTGGCDLESAAAVCAADDLPADEVLDLTSALVDQSVIVAEEAAPGHTRYRMLADIRQFGLERAEKDGELHGLHQRHATWYAELVSRFDDDACGPHQARLAPATSPGAREPAGRRRVLRRGSGGRRGRPGHGQETRPVLVRLRVARRGTPLAGASGWPRALGRRRSEPVRWPWPPASRSSRTTDSAPGSWSTRGPRWLPPSMTSGRSGCCWCRPRCSRSGTATRRQRRNRPTERWCCCGWRPTCPASCWRCSSPGVCHGFAGNSAEAVARHQQCIARASEVGELHMKALAVAGLGEQELAGGHLDEAAALFREAIVLKRELGDRMGMAVGLDSLGRVATAAGSG